MKPYVKDMIRDLKRFIQKLESNKPIKAVRVERHDTPDGPLHVRRKVWF